jgi:hypothetical protein
MDPEGRAVIVELKRGSHKLQLLQAISYAGMIASWAPSAIKDLASQHADQFASFLAVDDEEINSRQRIILIAEEFEYEVLVAAKWLTEKYGVDILCCHLTLATDPTSGAEYLSCVQLFPPREIGKQSRVRRMPTGDPKWRNWEEVLGDTSNEDLICYVKEEIAAGTDSRHAKRKLMFSLAGRRRWVLRARKGFALVEQVCRFNGDEEFWRSQISKPDGLRVTSNGRRLRFELWSKADFALFRECQTGKLRDVKWLEPSAAEDEPDEEDT